MIRRLAAVIVSVLAAVVPAAAIARTAAAVPRAPAIDYCAQIPFIQGVPPWGFHANAPITGERGSYARGHGNIDLATNTVSGTLCQVDRVPGAPDRLLMMTVEHHLDHHSHHAVLWGYPGNIMVVTVRVTSSSDPRCRAGAVGRLTLFASYNNVRSDSAHFAFAGGCASHDHTYHGTSVNAQVPPL